MIAACPKCGARYRVDPASLRPEGVRLRCSRCEAVFRVTPPAPPTEVPAPIPQVQPPRVQPPQVEAPPPEVPVESRTPSAPEAASAAQPPTRDRTRLVLIADPEIAGGKAVAHALAEWGLEPVLVHDGVEAILAIQRLLPRAVVLTADLPKMFGFQVCELMKRNESLRAIHVVLVGAIHHQERYRRPPSEIYGADAYVERPQLPEALRPILQGLGLPLGGELPASAPEPVPPPPVMPVSMPPPEPPAAPAPPPPPVADAAPPTPAPAPELPPAPAAVAPVVEPVAPPPAAAPPPPAAAAPATSDDPAVAAAERLARIIVSDIALYNPEKLEAGIQAGDAVARLAAELQEGRDLFHQRVDASVREGRDFLAEELERVARARGMK